MTSTDRVSGGSGARTAIEPGDAAPSATRYRRWRRWAAPAIAGVALLLGGCVRADINIQVHDDGSGTVSTLVALDSTLLSALGQGSGGANPFDAITAGDLPAGGRVDPYAQDGFTGVRITVPFAASDDVAAEVRQAVGADPAAGDTLAADGSPFQDLILRKEGDGWRLHAVVPASASLAGQDLSSPLAGSLLANASFTIHVTLPGRVVQQNADVVHGNELTWNMDLTSTEPRTLDAVTALGGGSEHWPLTAIAVGSVVFLVVLGGAAVAFQRWRLRAAA